MKTNNDKKDKDEMMQTKDPALTKTPIDNHKDHKDALGRHDMSNNGKKRDIENHEVEENTTENKGTDTFEEGIVETEHVNDDDNPARQPDRRDQEGTAFDDNVNERTVSSEAPDSHKINNKNRYATVDNAQTRVLNPDEKDHKKDR